MAFNTINKGIATEARGEPVKHYKWQERKLII